MSGKYQNNTQKKKSPVYIWLLLVIAAAVGGAMLHISGGTAEEAPAQTTESVTIAPAETTAPTVEPVSAVGVNMGYGLQMESAAKYTGIYMEDGSDELVTGVLSLVVTNTGAQSIQLADITMPLGEEEATFRLTTLGPGEKAVLLESNRMAYDSSVDYNNVYPTVTNVAYFPEEPSTMADSFKIGILNGAMNVTNISGQDIPGTITIYYKNVADGMYYGGITYRMTIEGGLKADEIRQLVGNHLSETGSQVAFITVAE